MPGAALTEEMISQLLPRGAQQEFIDSAFPHPGSFGVRVGRGGRRSFFLVYRSNGERRRVTLGTSPLLSLNDARGLAEEILRAVASGRDPAVEAKLRRRSPTLSEAADDFLSSESGRRLSQATHREYSRILSREILPLLGAKKIADLSPADLDMIYMFVGKQRGSETMAERTCSLIRATLKFAVFSGKLLKSPLEEWKSPRRKSRQPKKSDVGRLSFPELLRLWVVLSEEDPLVSGPFRLILLTGQKPGTILSMKWSQIRGDLWFIPTPGEKAGGASIPFYLSPSALTCLKSIQEQLKLKRLSGTPHVFPSKDGGRKKHLRRTAARLSIKLGMKKPFSPLSLRQAVRENLYDIGIRPDVIERILYPLVPERRQRGVREHMLHNYAEEVRAALFAWSKRLTTVTPIKPFSGPAPQRTGSKIVPLFPKGS